MEGDGGGSGRMEAERLCDRKGEWRGMEGDGEVVEFVSVFKKYKR